MGRHHERTNGLLAMWRCRLAPYNDAMFACAFNVVVSVLPKCCKKFHLPADKLVIEIREMHEAVRHTKAKAKINADKAELEQAYKKKPAVAVDDDPELGEAKSARQSSRRNSKSSRKSTSLPEHLRVWRNLKNQTL